MKTSLVYHLKHPASSCLHVDNKWWYAPAACGVVDSLRHSNAEYRGTSRELGYNGSAQYRPQVSFKMNFNIYYVHLKFNKHMHKEYILLNGFGKAKKDLTAGFHVPLSR